MLCHWLVKSSELSMGMGVFGIVFTWLSFISVVGFILYLMFQLVCELVH